MPPDSGVTNAGEPSIPFTIWESSGLTEHMGGPAATRRLVAMARALLGQPSDAPVSSGVNACEVTRLDILDIGCGTGYSARLLADEHPARVFAIDLGARSVSAARERAEREGLSASVTILQGNGQALPFDDSAVDLVFIESVAVFCDFSRLAAEVGRVLRSGGAFGDNELTLLGPAPAELHALLSDLLGIPGRQEVEWRAAWTEAGFTNLISDVRRISLREQLAGHIEVDGVRGYLDGMRQGLRNRAIARTFMNRRMLRAARAFLPLVGYGLYAGRKP